MRAPAAQLRVANPDDAEEVAAIYAPIVRGTAISFEIDPPDAPEMRRRIETGLAERPWLVAEDDAGVAGYAYASGHRARAAYRWSADASVYIAARARRRGIGNALYASLLAIVRAQGFHRVYAGITLPNAASAALHERHGFCFLGRYREVGFKLGRWHDVGWWELRFDAPGGAPREPRAFAAWRADAEGRSVLLAHGTSG